MKRKKRNNIISANLIIICFAAVILALFYPSNSPLGRFFDLLFILMVTRYIALAYGILMLLLRAFKIVKNNESLVYLLAGSLNLFIAIFGYIMYASDLANMEWLHITIQNLLVGFLIICDSIILIKKNS